MLTKSKDKEVDEVSLSNSIGKGTHIQGNVETYGNILVEGRITGDIKTKSKAVFGQSSKVHGNVLAKNAEVAGHIVGTIEITDLLILKPTAIIEGDIVTNKILVESGAVFNGKCKMNGKSREIKIGKPEEQERAANAG